MRARRPVVTAIVALVLGAAHAPGHGGEPISTESPAAGRVLGEIDFPTSTQSREAQAAFIRGMLLLHLFEYPFAREEFQAAQALDPGFAMAYWGEAMTHNHPIWDEQDREAGREALGRLAPTPEARMEKSISPREKDYLAALDILYGEGSKAERDRAYSRHMSVMAQRYPDDHEVRLFHALALMGVHAGVRDIPDYMESTALSMSVFHANPRHPGAAHYLIHGVDDPVHAPLGLEAARTLAKMAPDAGHSLHMTSHIFTAMGMWKDVVSANQEAVRVQNAMRESKGEPARHWGHYNFWLVYGLLQQGRTRQALEHVQAACREAVREGAVAKEPLELDPDRSHAGSVVQMWARYVIETRGVEQKVPECAPDLGEAFDPWLNHHFALGMRAALEGDAAQAREHWVSFGDLTDRLEAELSTLERQAPSQLLYLDRLQVMKLELEALVAWANGGRDQALDRAREASRLEGGMPWSFGPPFVDLPAAELLGDLLFEAGRHEEATEAYALQLERTRNKTRAVEGRKRAERQGTGS